MEQYFSCCDKNTWNNSNQDHVISISNLISQFKIGELGINANLIMLYRTGDYSVLLYMLSVLLKNPPAYTLIACSNLGLFSNAVALFERLL